MGNASVPGPSATLGEYLDECEGRDCPLDWLHLEGLAEAAIYDRATRPPAELEEMAARHRLWAAEIPDPEFGRAHRWIAEVLTDDLVAARLVKLLPGLLVEALETAVEVHWRPFPLRAEWSRRFRCDNCGKNRKAPRITFNDPARLLAGSAIVPSWCARCVVALAAEVTL